MSAILKPQNKLTTSFNFSRLPEAWGLEEILPDTHSAGAPSISSKKSTSSRNIDREEPCFVTKVSCFTHKRVHWVNAVRDNQNLRAEVEKLTADLGIVYTPFSLDSRVNLSNFDCSLHTCLDKYAFFAITGSYNTLSHLINMVETDNVWCQNYYDNHGRYSGRDIDAQLQDATFLNPQYELVALHPKHMLPHGKVLVAYSRDMDGHVSHRDYVPAIDNTLRESPGNLNCPRFPPFFFDYSRPLGGTLNSFLVILNAEIKFRQYLRQVQPAPLQLPDDVMNLVNLTIQLVKLLYWTPVLWPKTKAEEFYLNSMSDIGLQLTSEPFDAEMESISDEELQVPTSQLPPGQGSRMRTLGAGGTETLEERVECGKNLLSGRNLDFDSDDEDLLAELDQLDHQDNNCTQNNLCHVEIQR